MDSSIYDFLLMLHSSIWPTLWAISPFKIWVTLDLTFQGHSSSIYVAVRLSRYGFLLLCNSITGIDPVWNKSLPNSNPTSILMVSLDFPYMNSYYILYSSHVSIWPFWCYSRLRVFPYMYMFLLSSGQRFGPTTPALTPGKILSKSSHLNWPGARGKVPTQNEVDWLHTFVLLCKQAHKQKESNKPAQQWWLKFNNELQYNVHACLVPMPSGRLHAAMTDIITRGPGALTLCLNWRPSTQECFEKL